MILFVDASVIVAMLAKEDDALDLADRMDLATELIWSPLARWEASAALSKMREWDTMSAVGEVFSFSKEYHFRSVPIGDREYELAIEAYQYYGKGSGSAAKLNMGDCFAWACAKANRARLLYKGDDFGHTDLAWIDA